MLGKTASAQKASTALAMLSYSSFVRLLCKTVTQLIAGLVKLALSRLLNHLLFMRRKNGIPCPDVRSHQQSLPMRCRQSPTFVLAQAVLVRFLSMDSIAVFNRHSCKNPEHSCRRDSRSLWQISRYKHGQTLRGHQDHAATHRLELCNPV